MCGGCLGKQGICTCLYFSGETLGTEKKNNIGEKKWKDIREMMLNI